MKVPIVALVLAAVTLSSAPAMSQPREEYSTRVPYDGRLIRPPAPQRRAGAWVMLATPTPTRFGTEWIVPASTAGPCRTLRIEATTGTVYLRWVRVEYVNGKSRMFRLEQWLSRARPTALIDLGAPQLIQRIIVTPARMPAGMYAVHGA
ncbi:MAG: hypothetical protein NT062_34830 [Proteobacteria bacterium]|nr:hypothetical protein [Pseudomonadota bacterium]